MSSVKCEAEELETLHFILKTSFAPVAALRFASCAGRLACFAFIEQSAEQGGPAGGGFDRAVGTDGDLEAAGRGGLVVIFAERDRHRDDPCQVRPFDSPTVCSVLSVDSVVMHFAKRFPFDD